MLVSYQEEEIKMFLNSSKRIKSIIGVLIITLSIILPSAAQIYADSENYKINSLKEIGLTEQDINDLNLLSNYLKYNDNKGIHLYDIEKAKKNNIDSRLIEEAELYNKDLEEISKELKEEGNERKGRTYFKVRGSAYYEIGLSSIICKKIITISKNGAKSLAAFLIGLFPPIAPFVAPIADLFINQIAKNLKKYTKSGVVIKIRKMSGNWHIWYYQQ